MKCMQMTRYLNYNFGIFTADLFRNYVYSRRMSD